MIDHNDYAVFVKRCQENSKGENEQNKDFSLRPGRAEKQKDRISEYGKRE